MEIVRHWLSGYTFRSRWWGLAVGLVLIALATWLKYIAQPTIIPAAVPIPYYLAIVPTAILFGLVPGIIVIIISIVTFDFFFVVPLYTLDFVKVGNTPTLLIFLVIGVILSILTANVRHKSEEAHKELAARVLTEAVLLKYRDHLQELVRQRTEELERANFVLTQEVFKRKEAEYLTHKERDRLAALIDGISDEVWFTDTAQHCTLANPAVFREFGYTAGVPIEVEKLLSSLAVLNPDGKPRLPKDAPQLRALKGENIRNEEEIIITPAHHEPRYRQVSAAPVKDATGNIIGSVSVVRDITELKRAQQSLEKALIAATEGKATLQAIMDNIPEGITIADADLKIRYVSRYGEQILGGKYQNLKVAEVSKRWKVYREDGTTPLPDDDLPLMRAIQTGHTIRDMALVQVNNQGQALHLTCNAAPIIHEGRITGAIVAWQDTTARKRLEQSLRDSEERYRSLVELAPDAVVVHLGRKLLYANKVALKLYGANSEEELAAVNLLDLTHEDDRERAEKRIRQAQQGQTVPLREVRTRRLDGEEWVMEATAGPVNWNGKMAVQVVLRDITHRKKIEEELARHREHLEELVKERSAELRTVTRRLIEAQERERREVAKELHDQTGQYLTALRLMLTRAKRKASAEAVTILDEAYTLLGELVGQVRNMSLNLRPPMLDDMGLLQTMLWHVERYKSQTGIEVNFWHSGLERKLTPEINTAAYRIIQEALTNVARYAGVKQVEVKLESGRELIITVTDKGKGFNPAQAHKFSYGLTNMRERAFLVGGQLDVESALGSGTKVEAVIPLPD